MPGYSAEEIVSAECWEDWPDLDLVLIGAEPDYDVPLDELELAPQPKAA